MSRGAARNRAAAGPSSQRLRRDQIETRGTPCLLRSFAVIRRKLLAVFAILAMFGFVVSDSLPKLLNPNSGGRDQEVVTLYGKTSIPQRRSMKCTNRRNNANIFMAEINPGCGRNQFGGTKDRDLVDALILEHEADSLGIPAGPDAGRDFLKRITGDQMTSEIFDSLLARMNNRRRAANSSWPSSPTRFGCSESDISRARRSSRLTTSSGPIAIRTSASRQGRRDSGREIPRQGARADCNQRSRPCTKNTRTYCPTPPAKRRASRSPGRSRSRSSRSTAMRSHAGSWTS